MNSGLFTSNTCEWATPIDFFKKYDDKYNFTLDVGANADNAKCEHYFTEEQDGLSKKWTGRCWMNPPYGRTIRAWMKKAYESVETGSAQLVCCLVPARTDTAWWHDYAVKGDIEFIRGRLKFGGSKSSAPFPSAVVIFKSRNEE